MSDDPEELMETCKQNSVRNLCWFIHTTNNYHEIAKYQDYHTGSK
ncbi:MAG: hypothetical protein ACXQTE_02090 [Methanosarcinaceae archaeon]